MVLSAGFFFEDENDEKEDFVRILLVSRRLSEYVHWILRTILVQISTRERGEESNTFEKKSCFKQAVNE